MNDKLIKTSYQLFNQLKCCSKDLNGNLDDDDSFEDNDIDLYNI